MDIGTKSFRLFTYDCSLELTEFIMFPIEGDISIFNLQYNNVRWYIYSPMWF